MIATLRRSRACGIAVSVVLLFRFGGAAAAPPPRTTEDGHGLNLKALAPIASGPGVVICDPASEQGVDGETANFGVGCGRWLQFVIGGQGELGKTAAWSGLIRAQRELGRTDLRLKPAEIARLGAILGASHAATGTLRSASGKVTLTYQLWQIAGQKPAGPEVTASGSTAEIVQKLPGMAIALSRQLGVAAPHIPAAVGAAPAELTTLGAAAPRERYAVPDALRKHVAELAKRIPLAGIIRLGMVRQEAPDRQIVGDAVHDLLAQAPDNALCFGTFSLLERDQLLLHAGALQEMMRKYPANFNLAMANSLRLQAARDGAGAIKAAEQCVRVAPESPEAWTILGDAYATKSEETRQAKTWDKMTDAERTAVQEMYPKWLEAFQATVRLDPSFGIGWRETAVAATFAGNFEVADRALWKAVTTDRGDTRVYYWGLEMYHPKWFGDEAKRTKVADAAVAAVDAFASPYHVSYMAGVLFDNGYRKQALILFERAARLLRTTIADRQDDPSAMRALGTALDRLDRHDEALQVYVDAVKRFPNDIDLRCDLGRIYFYRDMTDDSLREFREALRQNPRIGDAHAFIGMNHMRRGRFGEAEPEFRSAIQLNPDNPDAHYGLGNIFFSRKEYEKAIAEYQEVIRVSPGQVNAYRFLSSAQGKIGKYDSALLTTKTALQFDPNNDNLHVNLSYYYYQLKQFEPSAAECRIAIRLNPKNAFAHGNLADALIELGHKAEAQAEWKLVLTLDHGQLAQEARDKLAKNP